jgi:hypothetical protein
MVGVDLDDLGVLRPVVDAVLGQGAESTTSAWAISFMPALEPW